MVKYFALLCFIFLLSLATTAQNFTISAGPSMAVPRDGHVTAALTNGKILVIGGSDGLIPTSTYQSSCTIYNSTTNAFEPAASLKSGRMDLMVATLNDGRVLAIGGDNNADFGTRLCEAYDPAANKWTVIDSLNDSHWDGAAVRLNDGRVLVAGGITNKTEVFDPATNQWGYVGDMSVVHGRGMSLTLLRNGDVLAVGGEDNAKTAEIFSPYSNSWIKISATTKFNKQFHSTILLPDGNVLLAGSSSFNTADQTTPEIFSYTWYTFSNTGTLLTNASQDKLMMLDNGNVLMYGLGDPFAVGNTKCFQEYNPTANTWSSGTYNFLGTSNYSVNRLDNGDFLLLGGYSFAAGGSSAASLIVRQSGFGSCVAPILSGSITPAVTEACLGKDQQVSLSTSSADAQYFVYIGEYEIANFTGAATPVSIHVPSQVLSIGNNLISFKARKAGCPLMASPNQGVVKTIRTNTATTTISSSTGNTLLCNSTSKLTLTASSSSSGSFLWSNNMTLNPIEVSETMVVFAKHIDANGCAGPASASMAIRKISSGDVTTGTAITVCQTATPIQLTGTPAGGTWTGTAVSSTGLFPPATSGAGYFSPVYNFCGYTAYQSVNIQPLNKVNYDVQNIDWGASTDTLCGGISYPIGLNNMNTADKYDFFIANQLQSSGASSTGYMVYYKPEKETETVLKFRLSKYQVSTACPLDSMIITKTFKVSPAPSSTTQVIFPDSACNLSNIIVKVVKPAKGTSYYSAFYPNEWAENKGPIVKVNAAIDTLYLPSRIFSSNDYSNLTVYALPGGNCTNAPKVYLGNKDVRSFVLTTISTLGNQYYVGQAVDAQITSNATSYKWTIDGTDYASKSMPIKTYATMGQHSYRLIAKSKHGCSDTLSKTVNIVTKPALASNSICLFDSVLINYNEYNVLHTAVDNKGNTIYVGSKYVDYAGNYSGSDNAFIQKYSKTGGKAIWRYEHSPYYATYNGFYAMYITSVAFDENNDIYITGGYVASELQFMGLTIKHTETQGAYPHTFVAKISEAGKMQWFIYTYTNSYNNYVNEQGGGDIKYTGGKLYVSARLCSQMTWKNQLGEAVALENPANVGEYSILEIDKEGTKVKALAAINSYGYSSSLAGLYNANRGGSYYTAKIAIVGPKLHMLPNNKLAVFGILRFAADFGNIRLTPSSLTSNTSEYVYNEYTGIVDVLQSKWESAQLEGATNSSPSYDKDKSLPQAVFTSSGDKISVQNVGYWYNPVADPTMVVRVVPGQLLTTFSANSALIKRIDKNGNLVWKKQLNGGLVHRLFMSSDNSQIVVVGTYQGGLSFMYGNENSGMTSTANPDIYAMGFSVQTGSLVWAEKVGSAGFTDNFYAAVLSPCNELLILGSRYRSSTYDPSLDEVVREQNKLQVVTDYPYALRIPLTGVCNSSNCALTTGLGDESESTSPISTCIVFPNPSTSTVHVKSIDGLACKKISLKDMNGRILQSFQVPNETEVSLSVSGLAAGMYLLEATFGDITSVHKLYVSK